LKFQNVFFEKGLGLENEEKASAKQSAIQRKIHKKSSLRDQRAIPKYKNQRSKNFESGESKKKIVQAKFRAQNLRFFIKIREKANEMTHPIDEKGTEMMRAFSGRFCHKKERSKCYISPFPTHNFDFKSTRNTCFCQMSFTFCIFYVLL
jgi:hypothetical protein